MMSDVDDDDPLFSEWARAAQPETHAGAHPQFLPSSSLVPSLAPVELNFDDEPPAPRVSPERREKLQRYVRATVVGCVVLCVAAAVRVGFARAEAEAELRAPTTLVAAARSTPPEDLPSPAVPAETAMPAPADIPPAPPIVAAETTSPPPAETAEPATASPSEPTPAATQTAQAKTSAPIATTAPVAVASTAPIATAKSAPNALATAVTAASGAPKSAVEERELARRALERGKLKDAVAAAERATAGDPGDAEAWLILGAAEQELGHASAARAAFTTCATSAKRGPVRECRAMLH